LQPAECGGAQSKSAFSFLYSSRVSGEGNFLRRYAA
jgi:hypothetical protein